MKQRTTLMYGGLAASCLAMLGYGLYAQYVQKFEPCPICYFQRTIIGLLSLVWLFNVFCRRCKGFQLTLQLLLCGIGAALSARHLWIQLHPDIAQGSCSMGIQYMLDNYPFLDVILKSWKGTTDCTDSSWRILGLTAPVWLIVFFTGTAGLSLIGYQSTRRSKHQSV